MFARLADLIVRRRRLILGLGVIALVVAGAIGGGVAEHLSTGGFDDPDAESSRAARILEDEFGQGVPNFLLLVTADRPSVGKRAVDDPRVVRTATRLTEELAGEDGVGQAVSYWTLGMPPPLRNRDATRALVIARVEGNDDEVRDRVEALSTEYRRDGQVIDSRPGGVAEIFREVGETIESDLTRAEMIALPITLLLLVLVFGSIVAASLPLAVGAFAVVGTFLILRLLSLVTDVSIFSLNLTTAMGLGLAIDYSLFVVSRFREEAARAGFEPDEAVRRTVRTAGRTVVFSALTVAVSLSALLVFPIMFLRSFAFAGIGVAFTAAIGAAVLLPALLAVLGHRVDKWVLWRRNTPAEGEGAWHRIAVGVMRRPWPIATVVVLVLLILGGPFLNVKFGLPDDRVLPEEASSRQVQEVIRTEFDSDEANATQVIATGIGDPARQHPLIIRHATALSRVDGVARVDALTGSYADGKRLAPPTSLSLRFAAKQGTWFSVVPAVDPMSPEAERMVADVRNVDARFDVLVGGPSAELKDGKASLFSRMPLAIGIICLVTFTLLFLMFGGLLVPAKALALNFLSLTATYGAMVWVFQDGHLSSLLDFTPTGLLDTTTPILMFCIAFGVSMDYEVFLLSRIKEEHDRSGDNVRSVALGLERTGRIVTAASVLLAVVFIAFATSHVTFIKLFGVGLTVAVLIDAFLIRATLVPAFMRLAGEANWWAPAPLRRLHARFGFSEHDDLEPPGAMSPDGPGEAPDGPPDEPEDREPVEVGASKT